MVQRKAPNNKPSPQAKAVEKQPHNHEKPLPAHHPQQDTKKKTRELRSITISDIDGGEYVRRTKETPSATKRRDLLPNYMKPTTSSDARKEPPPKANPAHQSPANGRRSRSPRSSKKKKKKPIRPSLRRNVGVFVCPNMPASRPTCSSTLKDSKFPKALELSPGATEAEGTSVIKVCPYTYCSLNGHRNEGLPPLKCFLASRRKLMKAQKSFRLKGRKKGGSFEEEEEEMDTGQAAIVRSKMAPLMVEEEEEEVDDFFVEIYAKPKESMIQGAEFDGRSIEEEDFIGEDARGESENTTTNEKKHENTSVAHLADDDDDGDRRSDFSNEEMDETIKFLEYVSCDQKRGGAGGEPPDLDLLPEDHVMEEPEKVSEDPVESESNLPALKASDMDSMEDVDPFPDNVSDCSESSDDGSKRAQESTLRNDELNVESLFGTQSDLDPCGMVEFDAEAFRETNDTRSDGGKEVSTIDDFFESEGVEIGNQVGEKENISNMVCEEKICEEEERIGRTSSFPEHEILPSAVSEGDGACRQLNFEANSSSESQVSNQIEVSSNIEEDTDAKQDETKENGITSKLEHSAEGPGFAPETQNFSFHNQEEASEEEGSLPKCNMNEASQFQDKEECEVDEICVAFGAMNLGEDESMDTTIQFSKNRYIIARRRTTQESEYIRDFNPRSPQFLPLEPDPEAEKVDLRHQMMDERKNAEEWMIDYALRKAVNKLAPARKKKVELLVEAFEAVIPIPACEKSVQNETTRFRPIQACS